MKTNWDAAPTYMAAEIAARVDYTALSWRERLLTPPPPGWSGSWTARWSGSWTARWSGSWTARLVSRLVPRPRVRAERENDEK